jgi:hypothetical protein
MARGMHCVEMESRNAAVRGNTLSIDILIGHRLPLYREVLVSTIQAMRPDLVVQAVLQEELEEALAKGNPWMVICCTVTTTVLDRCLNWIAICPDERDEAVVCVDGVTRIIPHAGIRELLEIVSTLRPRPDIHPNG